MASLFRCPSVFVGIHPSPFTNTGGLCLACITSYPVAAPGGRTIIPHSGLGLRRARPFLRPAD